jgi:hypothetical protein
VKIELESLSTEAKAAGRFAEIQEALTGASDIGVGKRGCVIERDGIT